MMSFQVPNSGASSGASRRKTISSIPHPQAANHLAASVAPAAYNAERVAARRDAAKRARETRAADSLDLAAERLAGASAAGEAAEELPDPPTPGYELLYTPGHGMPGEADAEDGGAVVVLADPKQIALPFHHIDLRA